MTSGVALTGIGSAVPVACVQNHALSQLVETSDEWIASRTGIQRRHLANPEDSVASLAVQAAQRALEMAKLDPQELELILLATSTPDDLFGTACQIQAALGAHRAVAFDLTAACSGFVFSLVTAAQFIRSGAYRYVLVIGADVLSRWVDWRDRRTCVLFGDGAGALVMSAHEVDRLLGFELRSDGSLNHHLNLAYQPTPQELLPGVTITQGHYGPITMNGQEVYRFAVRQVPEVIEKALHRTQLSIEQVDWFALHQANQRILDAVAQRLNIPAAKMLSNMARYGNTDAASIPLVMDEAVRSGAIQPGDVIVASGFGAGLSWGAAIFRWGI